MALDKETYETKWTFKTGTVLVWLAPYVGQRPATVVTSPVLAFGEGRCDFWPEGAVRKEYYVSNTSTEKECPSKVKTVGLLFEDMEGLTVAGSNTTLMFHGKMIMLAFDHCKQMRLEGLTFDFERPSASEITYTKVADGEVEATFHRDSRYAVADGKIHLFGEGWRSNLNHCIEWEKESDHFYYSQGCLHDGAVCRSHGQRREAAVRADSAGDVRPCCAGGAGTGP